MEKKTKNSKVLPVLIMGALSIGNIGFVQSGIWSFASGTVLDISSWNASAYQVESVRQSKEGSYIVTSKAAGFQSDVEVAVTFDESGEMIEQIEIISQAETDGIGTKVLEESFTSQFQGVAAPIGLKGKTLAIASPETGEIWGNGVAEEATVIAEETKELSNPEEWNADDQSPEAVAVRNLYGAGLLTSSIEKRPLETALADATPEERAKEALYDADLLASSKGGQPLTDPLADYSPEDKAVANLSEAGLTAAVVSADQLALAAIGGSLNEVDAVTGATVSSTAVVQAIDQAYFFMQEKVLQ